MGFPILVRWHLYIDSVPWSSFALHCIVSPNIVINFRCAIMSQLYQLSSQFLGMLYLIFHYDYVQPNYKQYCYHTENYGWWLSLGHTRWSKTRHCVALRASGKTRRMSLSFEKCSYISAGRCSPLPPLIYASPDKIRSDVGVAVILSCDLGYRFPGNITHKQVECLANQQWSDTYTECHRAYQCMNMLTKSVTTDGTSDMWHADCLLVDTI